MAAPEAFGWARHNEDPEAYWRFIEETRASEAAAQVRALEARQEANAERSVVRELASLRKQGLLRDDRLSYTRICELERETGIWTGSWIDFWNELRRAQQKDEERRR